MNKWKWGNFDKERLHVDRSYLPSLQTMRVTMIRLARQLVTEGKKDKAIALTDKYFEAFPSYNFQYDQFSAFMTDVYIRSDAKDKAAARIRDIAVSLEQQLRFHSSLSPRFQSSYQQEQQFTMSTAQNLMNMANDMKDDALKNELNQLFGKYLPSSPGLPSLPGLQN